MRLLTLGLGAWAFAPTPLPTLAALALFALTVALGNWQIGRADAKRAQQARYDAALSQAPIRLGTARLDPDQVLYRRLEVEGGFEAAHTILIDNRVLNGVAGYHVLTPLRIRNSRRSVLVNRGWVAVGGSRDRVPVFPTPAGPVRLEGIAADPNARFVELADSPPQGRV
ncbi:MAG TPA: SURF1 family protein, partial [Thiobacillaceae bacterium]